MSLFGYNGNSWIDVLPLEIFHKAAVYEFPLSLAPFIVFENGISLYPKKKKCLLVRSPQTFRWMMIEHEFLQAMDKKDG